MHMNCENLLRVCAENRTQCLEAQAWHGVVLKRENNNLFAVVSEKYRSTESLFHLPIFMISSLEMPALSALNPAGFIPTKSSACLSFPRTHFRSNEPINRENSGAVAGHG